MATYNYRGCTFNNLVEKESDEKRRTTRKRKRLEIHRPVDLPRICRFQQYCHLGAERCKYKHLQEDQLKGCSRPYDLCWRHPNCRARKCQYVHWRPEEKNEETNEEMNEENNEENKKKKKPVTQTEATEAQVEKK